MSGLEINQDWLRVDWSRSACGPSNHHLFESRLQGSQQLAKSICSTCPIRPECLEYAIWNETHGITRGLVWGGKSSTERRILLDQRQREVA